MSIDRQIKHICKDIIERMLNLFYPAMQKNAAGMIF